MVKGQYPDAGRLFQDDMKAIRWFCEVLAPENVCSLSALEDQNSKELDYRIEAGNLEGVTKNMTMGGFLPKEVVVPRPVSELSTKRILVMELILGPKLKYGVRSYFSHWAQVKREAGSSRDGIQEEVRRGRDSCQIRWALGNADRRIQTSA